jgi:3-oxoacid CoA-transferase subunit B
VTDLGIFEIKDNAFHLIERAPGVSEEEIRTKTAGNLVVPEGGAPEMQLD